MTGPTMVGLLRARAVALLERHGQSATGIARAMGRSHTWLLRKLDGDRPLLVSDLDELVMHLGVPAAVLLAPVLLPGDLELLLFLARGVDTTPEAVTAVFADGARALNRLQAQGLVRSDLQITVEGGAILAAN